MSGAHPQSGADLFDVDRLHSAWAGEQEAGAGRPARAEASPPPPVPVSLLKALREAAREAVGVAAPAIEQLLDRAAPLVATVSGQTKGAARDKDGDEDTGAAPPVTAEEREAAFTELEGVLDHVEDLLEALVLGPQRRLG